jgi:hypothetical protein
MSLPERIYGFDGAAADDVSVVVMQREPGGSWRVERTDGPDGDYLARVVARIAPTPKPPPPAGSSLAGQAAEWMAAHSKVTFKLTDEQRALLERTFARLAEEGMLTLKF